MGKGKLKLISLVALIVFLALSLFLWWLFPYEFAGVSRYVMDRVFGGCVHFPSHVAGACAACHRAWITHTEASRSGFFQVQGFIMMVFAAAYLIVWIIFCISKKGKAVGIFLSLTLLLSIGVTVIMIVLIRFTHPLWLFNDRWINPSDWIFNTGCRVYEITVPSLLISVYCLVPLAAFIVLKIFKREKSDEKI